MNMNGKLNIQTINPKTQSVEAVKALLAWKGRAVDPLPATVEFMNHGDESRLMLILSNDKAGYYTVTQKACSCPAAIYSPGKPCKHMKALQIAMEGESIRPKCGAFRPFSELPSEERAAGVA